MSALKTLTDLRRATKLHGDYLAALEGQRRSGEYQRMTPTGMNVHVWNRYLNDSNQAEHEAAAWAEHIETLRQKLIKEGYDPDA